MTHDCNFYMYLYKTIYCPFENKNHDRNMCVYAHNWQDYRRDPNEYVYSNKICPDWNSSAHTLQYDQAGCEKGIDCGFCHGWKEVEYHTLNYKTKYCREGGECRFKHCSHCH
jgi:hypothetical protein